MSADPAIHPTRSFGARAAAVRAARRIVAEARGPREAERNELLTCLDQEVAMLDRFAAAPGLARRIAAILAGDAV
jgi:hypothetical protein